MIPCRACKHWDRSYDTDHKPCTQIRFGSGTSVVTITDPAGFHTGPAFACVLAEPSTMTWQQFKDRVDELDKLMREKGAGCFVRRCKHCGHEGCWYEGVLDTLFIRCNEACPKCGSLDKTLELGIGEEYEL